MNIFEALSQGKGRINEETMSAMLTYFLNPAQTHGIGDTFLRRFLRILAEDINEQERFDDILRQEHLVADVFLEEKYELDKSYGFEQTSRTVDIEVRLYQKLIDENVEKHRIAIENKIRHAAAQDYQLTQEFIGIRDELADDDIKITVVFLTPYGNQISLATEYENLTQDTLQNNKKSWIRWHDDNELTNNVTSIIRYILERELRGEINPISEYVKHTLKAFAFYIENRVSPIQTKNNFEVGELIEQIMVKLSDGNYIIERYATKSIRVFKVDDDEYVTAKPVLRQIVKEKNLGDDFIYRAHGKTKNTRTLGYDVIQELVRRGLDDQLP